MTSAPPHRNRRPTPWLLGAAVALAVAVGCSSDSGDTDTAASTSTTTASTTATGAGGDLEAFCAAAPKPGDEVTEAYVGSAENVADFRELAGLAPEEVADDLGVIADHFEAEVDPADPDSQLTESFPEDVKARIEDVTTFIAESCDG